MSLFCNNNVHISWNMYCKVWQKNWILPSGYCSDVQACHSDIQVVHFSATEKWAAIHGVFSFHREKLSVARLQQEVARSKSDGTMVSFGNHLLCISNCPVSIQALKTLSLLERIAHISTGLFHKWCNHNIGYNKQYPFFERWGWWGENPGWML